jgi:hypothetical protein
LNLSSLTKGLQQFVSKYIQQAATAQRLLGLKGQVMDLFRLKFDVSYDPLMPEVATPEVLGTCKVTGVNLPASQGTIEAFDNRILQDPALRKSFRFFILAGQGLELRPQANDILKTPEGYCRVLGATPLAPDGGEPIIYNVGATLDSNFKFDDVPEPVDENALTI